MKQLVAMSKRTGELCVLTPLYALKDSLPSGVGHWIGVGSCQPTAYIVEDEYMWDVLPPLKIEPAVEILGDL